MRKELLKGLSEEQIKKVETCNSSDEVLALAKEEGIELTNEQLEAISGGCGKDPECPKCGSKDIKSRVETINKGDVHGGYTQVNYFKCRSCKYSWED